MTFGNLLLISMSTGEGLDVKMGSAKEESVEIATLSASISIDAAETVGNRHSAMLVLQQPPEVTPVRTVERFKTSQDNYFSWVQ